MLTGGTGFIGQKIRRTLVEQGYRVRFLVRDLQALQVEGPGTPFVGDLLNPDTLVGIEADIDSVIHCAAILGKWGFDEEQLNQVNVTGSLNLLRRFEGKSLRRFVHISAGGVSGPLTSLVGDETTPCHPTTAYERSKWVVEGALLAQAQAFSLPLLIVRPTFTYGPGDRHKLPLFRSVKKRRFAFIGSGDNLIHPVYIEDAVAGILLALERGRDGQVYIIGGEKPVSWQVLVYTIAKILKVAPPHWQVPEQLARVVAIILENLSQIIPFDPLVTRTRVQMFTGHYGYSIDKAAAELGYKPAFSLKEGLEKTIQNYLESGFL
ncbi:MAG: NAD-dependent epimerase/dehydratase family protein [Magnetococcales bacterium]|nr:NAD-dependent epimerase/dehydratase family protein [Magnetococcales bacterium]